MAARPATARRAFFAHADYANPSLFEQPTLIRLDHFAAFL